MIKPINIDALTVTVDQETGAATLSGIQYNDLRSILTAAQLHRFDHPVAVRHEGDADDRAYNLQQVAWHLSQLFLLDVLDAKIDAAIRPRPGTILENMQEIYKWKLQRLEEDAAKKG